MGELAITQGAPRYPCFHLVVAGGKTLHRERRATLQVDRSRQQRELGKQRFEGYCELFLLRAPGRGHAAADAAERLREEINRSGMQDVARTQCESARGRVRDGRPIVPTISL